MSKRQEAVRTAISNLNTLDYGHNPYLELYCNSVFQDDYCLQFAWLGQRVIWQQTNYLKGSYSPLWAHWQGEIPRLPYREDGNFEMLLCREVGWMHFADLQPIILELQKMKIETCYNNRGEGRDGQVFELCMGEGASFVQLCLSWWTCAPPDSWHALQPIPQQLLALKPKMQVDERAFFKATQELETTEYGHSLFLNCEKIG